MRIGTSSCNAFAISASRAGSSRATKHGPVERNAAEDLAAMVDVNLRAPIALTRLALPHLLARRGFAVQVASLAGKVPLDGAATYSATKFGLRAFSIALAQEVGERGVRIVPDVSVTGAAGGAGLVEALRGRTRCTRGRAALWAPRPRGRRPQGFARR
jgi:NAD(P)-dependent dehydrogenase (short-subunit alcohol dehydrogenase family)